MDSERRHELGTNSLASFLSRLPEYLRLHANKILLAIAAVAVVVLVFQYRARVASQQEQLTAENLSAAWSAIEQLPSLILTAPDGEQFVRTRDDIERDASLAIDGVLKNADRSNRRLLSAALLARGELYWQLSQLPEPPGATTRPALKEGARSTDELLKLSADAYQRVLSEFNDDYTAKITATFALAAIDEAAGRFDAARQRYQALIDDGNTLPIHSDIARARLALLDSAARPLLIGPPTTLPATTAPATTTAPAASSNPPPATTRAVTD